MTAESVPTFVYRCYDETGDLLYVGCSNNVEKRLATHAKSLDSWIPAVRFMEVEDFPDRRTAIRAETKAIHREHPYHNVMGRWMYRNEWTDEQWQRWGHMLLGPRTYGHISRNEQLDSLRRGYLRRFGRHFPESPVRGHSTRKFKIEAAA